VEILVYRTTQYIPLVWLGFSPEALLLVAVISTVIGHFNHANVSLDIGWLGYVLNNPRMHLWHHAAESEVDRPVNFGINLSVWDYLFGTAWVPDAPPKQLGFVGLDRWRTGLVWLESWPASRLWLKRADVERAHE
jgi:sterol desaturase/sphingolipid hydroxylase (fatty acid hydroxylase superfamily)